MAAVEAAGVMASLDKISLRSCNTLDEFHACLELQREVWGFSDVELVPLRVFSVANKIGGQVIGAWDCDTLAGFALSIPGSRNGHSYFHSHMVGVKEPYRNTGLGRRIKLFQRQDALARGYELMEWTFDPLDIKNAYFNLERLGAIARRYHINQYGITTSPLQGFLPTDRLVAEWWLKSKRVETMLASGQHSAFHAEEQIRHRRKSMHGRLSRPPASAPSMCRAAIARGSLPRFPAGLPARDTAATMTAAASFC